MGGLDQNGVGGSYRVSREQVKNQNTRDRVGGSKRIIREQIREIVVGEQENLVASYWGVIKINITVIN